MSQNFTAQEVKALLACKANIVTDFDMMDCPSMDTNRLWYEITAPIFINDPESTKKLCFWVQLEFLIVDGTPVHTPFYDEQLGKNLYFTVSISDHCSPVDSLTEIELQQLIMDHLTLSDQVINTAKQYVMS